MLETRGPLLVAVLAVLPSALAHAEPPAATELSSAMRQVADHIAGTASLGAEEIRAQWTVIERNIGQIGQTGELIGEALALVERYETTVGPLFMNASTRGGFPRDPAAGAGLELDRALFVVQQGLLDHAYTPGNLARFRGILDNRSFRTSSYFPGAMAAPADPTEVHSARVNASQPRCWGIPVMYTEDPARRPTGCYLAPGSIATVTVPPSMVNKGFSVRVGAHSWDLAEKPRILRLDRVSLVYPIESVETAIANPLGGGIYIEVPYEADAGIATVRIRNAVRAPFFSARSFDATTLDHWREVERHNPGPWADFESDKFMMQVPTKWVSSYDDPATLMRDWDTAMDCVSQLFGLPLVRSKTVLYLQVDVTIRGGAYFPGYPQSNTPYSPDNAEDGNSDHWLLRGPRTSGATIFHELGHAQLFTKFAGEVEAVVNLPYVSVLNKGFGVDLDTAFGRSFDNESISLDQAAIMWMVTADFRNSRPMDTSDTERNEVRYQHRGYGKYVEIAGLFGWHALERFWRSVQLDYMAGTEYPRNEDPADSRILRMSKAANADLTALIHFWGVHPEDPAALREAMAEAGLKPSARIYDRLEHYLSIIPMSSAAFADHANTIYPKGIRKGQNPLYGEGWYETWLPRYGEAEGVAGRAALQDIIRLYFPEGRPEE